MTRITLLLLAFLTVLAACGVDGPPKPPRDVKLAQSS
ncbi:MAG TPA: lipoprotein [Paenirhodobacter sp.]